MEEIWKDIKGFEGLYQVSNLGRIKNSRTGKIINPYQNNNDYYLVSLSNKGVVFKKTVHRLMAEAFLPNPDNLPCVNHKSECKTENFVWVNPDGTVDPDKSNLEWCTYTYNNAYGSKPERISQKLINGISSKPILQLTLDGKFIKEYPSIKEAERQTDINNACICLCCNGKLKTAGGFRWEYK